MSDLKKISIIIPALNPTERIYKITSGLIDAGFDDIIVINDGSGAVYTDVFNGLNEADECTVISHDKNMGKGAALKTAFKFFLETRDDKCAVITADCDGQHKVHDIVRCANALMSPQQIECEQCCACGFVVIGTRDFLQPGVPVRNSLGNRITSLAFKVLFGISLQDTQSGLRGIPAHLLRMLINIPGNRFDYETNMLIEVEHHNIPFLEVSIDTVYEEDSNKRSNFRLIRDSILIYSRVLKYAMSSIICFLADIGVFSLSLVLLGRFLGIWSIPCCTVIARAVSSFLNFNINRLLVFRRKKAFARHITRYYTLVIIQVCLSASLLWLLALPFGGENPVGFMALLKVFVDALLFFLGFYLQRSWVYR